MAKERRVITVAVTADAQSNQLNSRLFSNAFLLMWVWVGESFDGTVVAAVFRKNCVYACAYNILRYNWVINMQY